MRIGLVAVLRIHSLVRRTLALASVVLLASLMQSGVSQTANVLTQHNDLSRTGANPNETILTTSNVNVASFGKLFSIPVDGFIFAQPLYVSGVAIPGQGTHNVLYVATEHDSVYAFDADTGVMYWQVSLGTSVPASILPPSGIPNEIGITSTPVIDPSTGTLYVVPKTYESGKQFYRLHALDITTGAEKLGGPTVISASISGTASDGVGGIVTFQTSQQLQRPSLTLANGVVYIAFGSHGDSPPYHGWVLGYNAQTLQQVQVFNTTPNSGEGAIWMGGQGLVADSSNNLYMITANATQSTENAAADYGESFVKLVPNGTSLTAADYFKPNNYDLLNSEDGDLGSGGIFAIPGTSYVVGGGKLGTLYVVDTNNMGELDMSADQVVQEFQGTGHGLWGAPAYFNNTLYIWGYNDPLRAFHFNGHGFDIYPTSNGAYIPNQATSGSTSVSSNGTTPGTTIVWATAPISEVDNAIAPGNLYAYDATNLSNLLWSTSQNPTRDAFGNYAKFTAPTIANGKVYVGTENTPGEVSVYGLLSATVELSNLSQTYTGSPLAATATTTPSGLTVNFSYTGTSGTTYGPSATPPTNAGSYTVVATISDGNYQGTTSGTLTIAKATATVTLGGLAQTYTGSPLSATATTTPAGLTVNLTYNGVATAPTAEGSYTVVGTISDANYQGSATGTMMIGTATATVTLGNLAQTYTGSPLSATATTTPSGLKVTFTYNGSSTAPTAAGSYTVVGTINDVRYVGSATGTMVIGKATATVTLGSLSQAYTGSPISATDTTTPAGLKVTFTYNGSSTAPTATGSYTVVGTINDTNYQGSATGTLVIGKATATVTLGGLAQTYTGAPLAATATTTPTGITVNFTYTGTSGTNYGPSATPPTNVGSYTVVATISDAAHTGTATGVLVIAKATPAIIWPTPAAITYGTALTATQLNATSTVAGTFIYTPALGSIPATGSQQLSVTLTPTDTSDYNTATAGVKLTVNGQSQTISLSSGTQSYASGVSFGVAPLALSATSTSGLAVTFSVVSGPATLSGNLLTITGAGTVAIAANQAGNGNYLAAPQIAESITVNKALPVAAISASTNDILLQNPVTLTATSASSAGTPTGTVTFMDGATPLGTGTLAGGTATLTTSSLAVGSHTITAAYGGDVNFLAAASSPITQLVQDFSVTVSTPTATANPGGTGVFTFTVDPMDGATLPAAINLTLSGLPSGATFSFSPASIAAGAGSTTVTLTVDIPQAQAGAQRPMLIPGHGKADGLGPILLAPFSLAFVLLPFAGRLRRMSKRFGRMMSVLLLVAASMAALAGISACGGSSSSPAASAGPQNYNVTITGTSGALAHSATAVLTVE